ncbi:MAG TPA: tRNA (adenosine(37)-N6)-dimethylallyltransferase MiaA [Candidatus Hydrothermia bacterium]|nr:tRNA (adenosine(37)-N6)-dimethylallyltransferase MiaA [Candidatus Hydrothermae bacterium]MDD3649065.1 tRNA (adenosine(37)-N6)-dimethylallyltransferase MiaA [Candidatus Hydrothermia bacterium]HOK23004.1 tRNA (adenosine(37)-N6)-dimethylallyltransferase MiaA [Candidatus Hydrothermia bacterium]HOL23736.1 tRNA (adenosine(37)-N6)-dimethylallyltransferase MiaA [Candidatus Hydrothermia bacterium]HOP32152.1 tRNA (adenosine(37)-N6)-dimethylallyltransferase MiaA [Candidatus Hydrothermia bacterium]
MEIISIIGPTACGKKEIALHLINTFGQNLRFISCDSRKVYRHMDIGTAKPPPEIRHYFLLIDIRDPDKIYSAGDFVRDAERFAKDLIYSGVVPVIIGGTPLYYKALFSEFFEEPNKDPAIRKYILDKMKNFGLEKLYEELKEKDPESAAKLHPNDWIRITRSLEIIYTLGIPASEARKKMKRERIFEPQYIGLALPTEILYAKIEERTKKMFEGKLLEETENLLKMGYNENLPSMNTIGYKEAIKCLKGEWDNETCINKIIRNTKIYARRQMRFFKTFENVVWFDLAKDKEKLIHHLESEIEKRLQ